jgi:hypothetical protein
VKSRDSQADAVVLEGREMVTLSTMAASKFLVKRI